MQVLIIIFHSYLALVAGLASEADYIFIPEAPAVVDWQDRLCNKLLQVLYDTQTLFIHTNYYTTTCYILLLLHPK